MLSKSGDDELVLNVDEGVSRDDKEDERKEEADDCDYDEIDYLECI